MDALYTYKLKPEKRFPLSLAIQQGHVDVEQTEKAVSTILPFRGLSRCSPAHFHGYRCLLKRIQVFTFDACRLMDFLGEILGVPDLQPILVEEDDIVWC